MFVIPALWRLRQEDYIQVEASLGYVSKLQEKAVSAVTADKNLLSVLEPYVCM